MIRSLFVYIVVFACVSVTSLSADEADEEFLREWNAKEAKYEDIMRRLDDEPELSAELEAESVKERLQRARDEVKRVHVQSADDTGDVESYLDRVTDQLLDRIDLVKSESKQREKELLEELGGIGISS